MVLASVQYLYEDEFVVRAPAYVGQVALLSEVSDLGVYGTARGKVVDAKGYELGIHTVHRVFDLPEFSRAGVDVQEREVRDTAFVLAVEGKFLLAGGPEDASVYAKLVAADAFSVGDLVILAYGNNVLYAVLAGVEKALVLALRLVFWGGALAHLRDVPAEALRRQAHAVAVGGLLAYHFARIVGWMGI